ncbi:hypothetical protein [Coleofasciculus sp. FACHB-1120]|nr:hypothetical protein [Coleofasciculus sp. FACHB-1120]
MMVAVIGVVTQNHSGGRSDQKCCEFRKEKQTVLSPHSAIAT